MSISIKKTTRFLCLNIEYILDSQRHPPVRFDRSWFGYRIFFRVTNSFPGMERLYTNLSRNAIEKGGIRMSFLSQRKKVLTVFSVLCGALVLTLLVHAVAPDQNAPVERNFAQQSSTEPVQNYAEGEVLVVFREGMGPSYVRSIADSYSMTVKNTYPALTRILGKEMVHLKSEYKTTEDMIQELEKISAIESVEPNYLLHIDQTFPNDPSFNSLWGLHNTGQTGGTPDIDIDAPEAWDKSTGSSSAIVVVIDTGIDYNHADLSANMWTNPGETPGNGIDDEGNGFIDDVHGINAINMTGDPMDDHGHGTHCAGTIGAVGNNSLGVVGVNWDVTLIGAKFLAANGSGYTSDAVTCVDYATDLKTTYGQNIVVTNNSWGGGGYSTTLKNAIDASGTAGIVFCAAAGNDWVNTDISPHYPSSYTSSNIISVTAVEDDGDQWYNYGPTTVDLGAPGVSILSTYPGGYAYMSGTSMATPHVSGAVALISQFYPSPGLAESPASTVSDRIDRILNNTVSLPSLIGKCVTGGMLNANLAIGTLGPEINVRVGGNNFADGSVRNLGTRMSSFIMGRNFTFTIDNLGTDNLELTGSPKVTLGGTHAAHFQITQQPTSPVAPAGTTTFVIRTVRDSLPAFLPIGWTYPISFTVNIPNNDSDENPYNFTIEFTLQKDT
jgi:subtilisin family serine protease